MKICIPSKNRADSMTTPFFFKPEEIIIFVEPHEYRRYKIYAPDYEIINIGKSDQGITYVRNFIFDYVKDEKMIMADDDIEMFGIRNKQYRYDTLNIFSEMLKDIEDGLDKYWCYTIPFNIFAFFENRHHKNENRLYVNSKPIRGFYGINLKKIKENNILFDSNIKFESIDFTMQVLLNDGDFCSDAKYILTAPIFKSGGQNAFRNIGSLSLDEIVRQQIDQLSKKFGAEFVKFRHDNLGYAHSCTVNFDLLIKRKDILRKHMLEYYKNT